MNNQEEKEAPLTDDELALVCVTTNDKQLRNTCFGLLWDRLGLEVAVGHVDCAHRRLYSKS